MKTIFKLFRLAVAVVLVCLVVALLEIFDLHPQFSVGNFHAVWVGVRKMEFQSGIMTVPLSGGRKEVQNDYTFGPIKIILIHAS